MATPTKEAPPTEVAESSCDRLCEAQKILKNNMYWGMGAGLLPLPVLDTVAVGAVQIRLIKKLSDLYGIKFSEHRAKNIVAALIGSLGAGVISVGTVASCIKVLPFAGALIGGIVAVPVISGAVTYALGKVFIQHFEAGGTLLDFNPEKTKAYFAAQFQEGRKLATDMRKA